jgi:hypothetical protein
MMSGVENFSIIKVYHYCDVVKGPGQNTRRLGREIAEKLRKNVLKILNIMPSS